MLTLKIPPEHTVTPSKIKKREARGITSATRAITSATYKKWYRISEGREGGRRDKPGSLLNNRPQDFLNVIRIKLGFFVRIKYEKQKRFDKPADHREREG